MTLSLAASLLTSLTLSTVSWLAFSLASPLVLSLPQLALASPQATSTVEVVATTITQTITTTPSPSPLSSQYSNDLDFRTSILNSTNFFRYEHSAGYVYWNTTLASYAQEWANKCNFVHSHGPYGENLARGYPNVTQSVDAWGNERALYNFSSSDPSGFTEATGHFTQLVWKSTTSTGCGWVNCNGKNGLEGVFLVCEYWPPGNLVGDNNFYFKQNVASERSQSDVGFNEGLATQGATGGTPSSTGSATGSNATPTNAGGHNSGAEALLTEGAGMRVLWAIVVTVAAVLMAFGMS